MTGTIASRNGSDNVAPSPLRTVRRGNDFEERYVIENLLATTRTRHHGGH
jgi:hypothetical protein